MPNASIINFSVIQKCWVCGNKLNNVISRIFQAMQNYMAQRDGLWCHFYTPWLASFCAACRLKCTHDKIRYVHCRRFWYHKSNLCWLCILWNAGETESLRASRFPYVLFCFVSNTTFRCLLLNWDIHSCTFFFCMVEGGRGRKGRQTLPEDTLRNTGSMKCKVNSLKWKILPRNQAPIIY